MTADTQKDADDSLTDTFLVTEITEENDASVDEINSIFRRIKYLMVYVRGMYSEDRQRKMAEAEIYRLRIDLVALIDRYIGETNMLIDMHQPFAFIATQPR